MAPIFARAKAATMTLVMVIILGLALPQAAAAHDGHVHGEAAEQAAESQEAASSTAAETEPAEEATSDADPAPLAAAPEQATGGFFALLTNLHPVSVHFPIALLIVAAFAQFLADRHGSEKLADAAAVMAIVGGAAAFVAALFGWIHTGLWFGGDNTMHWHRWVGTSLGIAGPLVAWLAAKRVAHPRAYRSLLYMMALALLFQGYWGAEISFGAGHLWK